MTIENKATRPNFFILLGLNPDAPWSDAEYEKALKNKQSRWGRDATAGVGASVHNAQRNIRLVPEIKRVMEDPQERAQEAIAARALLMEEKKQRQADFETRLAFLNAKRFIEQVELDKFVEAFKDIFTAQEIKDRITVPIGTGASAPLPPQLEPILAKNIAQRLAHLHMTSLYELFGPGSDMLSTAALRKTANDTYLDIVRRAHNEDDTAKKELAGYAKEIFESEETRKKYDETRRLEKFNALLKKLDEVMSHAVEKHLHVGQVELFLQDAQKAGCKREESLQRIQEYARSRKWSMDVPAVGSDAEKICCAYCKHLNDKGQNFCSSCNKPLFFTCPDCGQKVLCEYIACGQCGFPVGNHYYVERLLEDLELSLKRDALAEARDLASEAEKLWHPKKADVLALRISALKTNIDTKLQQFQKRQKEVSEQCTRLIAKKKFFEAQRLLRSTVDVMFVERETLIRRTEETIAQAEALMKRAQASGVSIDERTDLCCQVLHLCSDYQTARDLLSMAPPPPPQNLRAQIKGQIVNLSWDLVPLRGITYHIIRKSRAQPKNSKDGRRLESITGQTYDDTTAEIGLPLYYAVYSECEQVFSRQGAFLARSVLITQDVTRLIAKVSSHQVELSWVSPRNVSLICILRKENKPPVSLQDGTLLAKLGGAQKRFRDQNVENERNYHYAIYCQFENQERNLVTSRGVHVMVTPGAPPQVITSIDIKELEMTPELELLITWERPKKGNVVVLKSSEPLALGVGDMIEEDELSLHGQRLEYLPDSVKDTWTASGIAYYTPVVLIQKWAYVGTTQRYCWVNNVSDLKSQNLGSAIRLQWSWPEQCEEVVVSFSPQGWPEASDLFTTTRHLSRATYDQFGYYDIKGKLNQDYYITVSAIVKFGGEYIPARELRTTGRILSKMVFHYEIKKATFFHRRPTLHITPRTSGTLPALLLIGKRDRLPMNKSDGDIVYHISPMTITGKKITLELPDKPFPPNTFGKLFLEYDHDNETVIIHQPEVNKLRLH
jgi:hypothetical protein